MTPENPPNIILLRQGFKSFNQLMLLMWRLGWGPWINAWPPVIGRIMVITHTGRKTGLLRRTPVNYAIVDGELYCTAGYGRRSDWFRNLQANPQVQVWLPDGWWAGTAKEITDPQLRLPLLRQVLIASGFAAYLAGINPQRFSDQELEAMTRDYCLIHIRRTAPRTGHGGPGDLWWVWPTATFALLGLLFLRRRVKR